MSYLELPSRIKQAISNHSDLWDAIAQLFRDAECLPAEGATCLCVSALLLSDWKREDAKYVAAMAFAFACSGTAPQKRLKFLADALPKNKKDVFMLVAKSKTFDGLRDVLEKHGPTDCAPLLMLASAANSVRACDGSMGQFLTLVDAVDDAILDHEVHGAPLDKTLN